MESDVLFKLLLLLSKVSVLLMEALREGDGGGGLEEEGGAPNRA